MHLSLMIRDFFQSQFDYTYFFYGLSFFLLSIICLSFGRGHPRSISWFALGSFSLLHGFHEWMEMAVIFYDDTRLFSIIRLIILALSYIFLFEFTRVNIFGGKGRWHAISLYLLILITSFHGHMHDIYRLNAVVRYFMAFPAGLLAAFVVVHASRTEVRSREPLYILGAVMAVYAIVAGLIVSKSEFWPANLLNTEIFYQSTGIPVQAIRGLLILCAAIAIWFYSQALPGQSSRPIRYSIHFKPSKWAIAFTMLTLISLGWAFTNYFDYYASNQIIKSSKADMHSPLNVLNRELTKLEWGGHIYERIRPDSICPHPSETKVYGKSASSARRL